MPKRHQQHPAMCLQGHNNPKKTTVITTGTPKTKKAYKAEALRHENPAKPPPITKVRPEHVLHPEVVTKKQDSGARLQEGAHRSGSASNAHSRRKHSRLHEQADKRQPESKPLPHDDFEEDLRPDNFKGANHGLLSEPKDIGLRASDIKELYQVLPDLSTTELRDLVIIPVGERLEQGAKYIDLLHREQGEFTAMANMVVEDGHDYVPKDHTGYVLWNRLRGITSPARLDEAER